VGAKLARDSRTAINQIDRIIVIASKLCSYKQLGSRLPAMAIHQAMQTVAWNITSSAVALLEFLAVAAWARIVAAHVFQGVAHRLLVSVAAVRAVYMAMVVIMVVVMGMIMIVIAVWAMNVGLLGHRVYSGIKSAGIITPLRATCT
jgi:hypothetical protein